VNGPAGGARRVALGAGAAIAFAVVYLLVAPPTRRWVAESLAAPALAAVPAHVAGTTVAARASPPAVLVEGDGTTLAAYSIPLGVLFFLPALLLLALAPGRPWWLIFAAVLLALGLLDLVAVAAGIRWGRAGFVAHEFMDSYVIRPASIAVPLLMLYARRR